VLTRCGRAGLCAGGPRDQRYEPRHTAIETVASKPPRQLSPLPYHDDGLFVGYLQRRFRQPPLPAGRHGG
jgi:hypothetical protein